MRSRAESLPSWCCLARRSSPPPASAAAWRRRSSSIRSGIRRYRVARFALKEPNLSPLRPKTVPRLLAATLLCGALACAALLAQNLNNDTTIRANVHLVLVPVTVTDAKGKFVDGLQAEDFVLYDDGVPQRQLQVDSSDTVLAPVALVIAIQASGISQAALEKIHKIGSMFAPLISGEKGEAAVLAYDDEVRLMQGFTRDSTEIERAFESINGRTLK